MNYLEANISAIPANRTIIIIPTANPDGAAIGARLNAHNVDLNRNFPANNWKSGVTEPGGVYYANGGGSSALSEPESSAIANYILSQDPLLVMSYHAAATLIAANESGNSLSLAKSYAKKSGYPPAQGNEAAAEFAYDTTGAMEDWLHDKHNIPAILVELRNKTGNEFSAHKNAMLAMIQF
jgi:murein peptide amidase A